MPAELLNGVDALAREHAVARAAELLRGGLLVAFPTETVYGLGADALNPAAIAAAFDAKGRPADNPLIVHVHGLEALVRCAVPDAIASERLARIAAAFMPGPITVVLPAAPAIPAIARAGLPTVALRIPDHPLALELLAATGPLVAPSANRSGRPSPTTAAHVFEDLADRIAAVLDGGPCRVGLESTVLDLSADRPAILRPGEIDAAAIERVLGEDLAARGTGADRPKAPGMKYRHYAPAARVRLLLGRQLPKPASLPVGCMVLTTPRHAERFDGCDVRSLRADTLYALFREADLRGLREIVIYAEPDELSDALLDRVRKAAEG